MLRVLLVPLGWTPEDATSGQAARALRDAGHEVVHGGAVSSAGQVAACALQEDVDVVLVLGDAPADGLADELRAVLGDDVPVSVSRPGAARADVLEAVSGSPA